MYIHGQDISALFWGYTANLGTRRHIRINLEERVSPVVTDRDKDLCLGNCGIITKWLSILELLLGDGAVKVSDVHDIMSEKGISDETAQRARERIGAVQEYVDGIAVWRIPE